VRAAVEDVHHRDRQQMSVLVEVAPARPLVLGGLGASGGHRDAEDGVGAEPSLVLGAVEIDERAVEGSLVGRVAAADRVGDLAGRRPQTAA
jgi:hypothetical protein